VIDPAIAAPPLVQLRITDGGLAVEQHRVPTPASICGALGTTFAADDGSEVLQTHPVSPAPERFAEAGRWRVSTRCLGSGPYVGLTTPPITVRSSRYWPAVDVGAFTDRAHRA